MWRRIREPFGTAGLIVAVIALVAALAGGAYAASGALTGKQKKEVEKIAKKYAGKPGAPGAAGAQGQPGTKGDTGAAGANGQPGATGDAGGAGSAGAKGEPGTPGKSGLSPKVVAIASGEAACGGRGGVKVVGIQAGEEGEACNGTEGGGAGGFPETLPSGSSESGLWEVEGENGLVAGGGNFVVKVISFPVPLAAAPSEFVIITSNSTTEEKAKCPGTVEEPAAAVADVLCVYDPDNTETGEPVPLLLAGLLKNGSNLTFSEPEKAVGFGSWAVKAP